MPYNGAGVFTRNYNWVNDRNSAIPITASRMDADSNDFATGLSAVVTRDGQGPVSSKLVVNGVGATPFAGGGASDSASAYLLLNKHGSSHGNEIYGCSDGLLRWQLEMGNTLLESGGGSGSDWALNRYNDAGTFVDTPITIARSTGIVTIGNLNVLGGISAPISATNISASGTLSVGGTSTFTGAATFSADYGVQLNVAAGLHAQYVCTVAGQRQWSIGEETSGYFRIADLTAGVERLIINSAGAVSIGSTLTVTGGFVDSSSIQCNVAAGQNALYYGFVSTVRQWYWGVLAGGTYTITDATGGVARLGIDTAGHCTVTGALTCSGNFNTNQINGTIVIASQYFQVASGAASASLYLGTNVRQYEIRSSVSDGFLYFLDTGTLRMYINTSGNVVVVNSLTVSGTFNTNGIVCTTINTQNNNLTMGTGDITCQNITASATVTVQGFLNVTGGPIDTASTGVGYTGLGAARYAFHNAGTSLTFYVGGVATGVWGFNTPSDERIKANIAEPEGDALLDLRRVKLISFDMTEMRDPKYQPTHLAWGFSAQQMETVIPEAVNRTDPPVFRNFDAHPATDDEMMLTIDIMPLLARCVGAIQQLADRIEAIEKRSTIWT